MPAQFLGRFSSGQSPLETEVTIAASPAGLIIHTNEEGPLFFPFKELRAETLPEGTLYGHKASDATILIFHRASEDYQALPGVERILDTPAAKKGTQVAVLLLLAVGMFMVLYKLTPASTSAQPSLRQDSTPELVGTLCLPRTGPFSGRPVKASLRCRGNLTQDIPSSVFILPVSTPLILP